MNVSEYSYQELRDKILSGNYKQEDLNDLLFWFQNYGSRFWNGESYEFENGKRLKPIYKINYDPDGEIDTVETIGAELI